MVRYPIEQRRSIADLENMRIRTPSGDEVPFRDVAEVEFGKGYSSIARLDRQRTVTVSADIDPAIVEPRQIIADMSVEFIPELLSRYPGVQYGLEGASQDEQELKRRMMLALVASIFMIYALDCDSAAIVFAAADHHVGHSVRRNWCGGRPRHHGGMRSACSRCSA